MNILPRFLAGRCANGAEADGGLLWHAVDKDNKWIALCGAKPGKRSAGWAPWDTEDAKDHAVTCPRCLAKLKKPILNARLVDAGWELVKHDDGTWQGRNVDGRYTGTCYKLSTCIAEMTVYPLPKQA